MIECAACHATNAPGLGACAKCGAPLAGLKGGSRASELQDDALFREANDAQRIRRMRKIHAVVGAMTFFLLQLLVGLPHSLLPLNLLVNAVLSTIAGLPIGWLISRSRGGAVKGALISAGAFMAAGVAFALVSGTPIWLGLACVLIGVIPGAFIGIHVAMDE